MKNGNNWTLVKVIRLSKPYCSRSTFQKENGSAYSWAKKNVLLNEIFPHLPPVRKRGFWKIKCNVIAESQKYSSRMEFKENARQAYNVALENEWQEAFSHFTKTKVKGKSIWQEKSLVKKEALKYKTRTDFQKSSNPAWRAAKKNGWEDVFSHMDVKIKPGGYWDSYENCKQAAIECDSIMGMRARHRSAYEKIKKNKWDELFSHMKDPRIGRQAHNISAEAKDKGWCLETILPIAQQFSTRSEFEKKRPSAYKEATKLGILDKVCTHMAVLGNHFKRGIYAIEFEDGSVYVGLTYNYTERFNQHKRNSSNKSVRNKINDGIKHEFIAFEKYFSPEKAVLEEKKKAEEYINRGFKLINIGKLGGGASLGGGGKNRVKGKSTNLQDIKWNKPSVLETAKKCSSRSEFKTVYSGAWRHARHHGYLNECH